MISVIIPLYNKYNCIERSINSVIKQSFADWELIIIDDGSTDNSASIVEKYLLSNKIKLIRQPNGGVSNARNHGIKEAQGEWIVFLDADDYFLPDALYVLHETAIRNKTLISTANFLTKKDKNERIFCNGRKETVISNNYRAWFFRVFFPRTGAALFHHTILKEHLFDESLCRYEDAKSLFDIFRNNRIAYSPKLVMVYSLDDTGLSHRVNDVRKDFIFNMNFEGKSFWEKITLSELLLEGYKLYPEHSNWLKIKNKNIHYIIFITKLLRFFRKIYNRLITNI